MASVEYNKSIQGFHGILGNMIFYEREGDPFVRKRWKISKPQSEAQKAQRSAFHDAAAAWRLLSGEIKENWKAIGREQRMTGYNVFLRVNILRLKRGEAITTEIPGREMPAPRHEAPAVHADEGCRKFMESIYDMVESVSREAHAHAGRITPPIHGGNGCPGHVHDAGRLTIPADMVRRIASHHELRMYDPSVSRL